MTFKIEGYVWDMLPWLLWYDLWYCNVVTVDKAMPVVIKATKDVSMLIVTWPYLLWHVSMPNLTCFHAWQMTLVSILNHEDDYSYYLYIYLVPCVVVYLWCIVCVSHHLAQKFKKLYIIWRKRITSNHQSYCNTYKYTN